MAIPGPAPGRAASFPVRTVGGSIGRKGGVLVSRPRPPVWNPWTKIIQVQESVAVFQQIVCDESTRGRSPADPGEWLNVHSMGNTNA